MMLDAAVVGGGPGGSVCAALLATRGWRVALFERQRHPRFHLGESLLPQCLGVLDAIGILDDVSQRFLVKRGARFVDARDERRSVRYDFAEAFHAKWDHAFQVPRDEFDELLFRRAGALGVELHEGWTVTGVVTEKDRAVGIEVRNPEGTIERLSARFVVDASGRDAMIAHHRASTRTIPALDRTALFTQVTGCWRDSGDREGDVQIVVFGPEDNPGWFWFIPFAGGRTSVGAVVSPSWLRSVPTHRTPTALWAAAVADAPAAAHMLAEATPLFEPRSTADFSYRVQQIRGAGWLCVGDAAGFIDPLFSTGAYLAMHGAQVAAEAIDAALRSGLGGSETDEALFTSWEREMRRGSEAFIGAVQAFYSGQLARLIFANDQRPFLRRAITSMLSGDVFDERRAWARELRSRFPARLSLADVS
jgi:flavin-dependent dehydrogenase